MSDITQRIADAVRKAAFYTDPNGELIFGYSDPRIVVGVDPYISELSNIVAAAVVEELGLKLLNDRLCDIRKLVEAWDLDPNLYELGRRRLRSLDRAQILAILNREDQ